MALKSTIFKADLQVADLDRGHFGDYTLTIARHPSETDERMMVRLLAFAMNAAPDLAFGRGLSTEDDPALAAIDLTGELRLAIEVGLPDEERLRKLARRARAAVLVVYGGRAGDIWWQQNAAALGRLSNLQVWRLTAEASAALAKLAERTMRLACTLQEGTIYFGDVELRPERLQ
jgi:uncharacterized protein YaeQ